MYSFHELSRVPFFFEPRINLWHLIIFEDFVACKCKVTACAQVNFTYFIIEIQTCIHTLVFYDTEVLPWHLLEACHIGNGITLQ